MRGIFCEKALACSLAEADRMLEACRRHGVAFNYGAGRRYRGGYRAMRRLAAAGALGTVQQQIYNGGSPALLHGLSHAVDTALFLLGEPEVASVQATFSRGRYDPQTDRWDDDPHVAQAAIHFRDGAGAHFCVRGARWYSFSLVGTDGLAEAYDNNARYRLRRRADDWYGSEEVPFPPFEDESDTVVAIRELTRAVAAGTPEATERPDRGRPPGDGAPLRHGQVAPPGRGPRAPPAAEPHGLHPVPLTRPPAAGRPRPAGRRRRLSAAALSADPAGGGRKAVQISAARGAVGRLIGGAVPRPPPRCARLARRRWPPASPARGARPSSRQRVPG